jgi:hypothetical protein
VGAEEVGMRFSSDDEAMEAGDWKYHMDKDDGKLRKRMEKAAQEPNWKDEWSQAMNLLRIEEGAHRGTRAMLESTLRCLLQIREVARAELESVLGTQSLGCERDEDWHDTLREGDDEPEREG